MKILVVLLSLLSFQASSYELYLVRHFEKRADEANPSLTALGQTRANALVALLADKKLVNIYSSDYRRTQQTATPIAVELGLPILSYPVRDLAAFTTTLLTKQQTSLVVGHSNTTAELIKMLGGDAKPIAENEYGELFILIMLPASVITQSVKVGSH